MKTQRFDRIEAKEICLLDRDGRTRIRMAVDEGRGGWINILDGNGKPLISIRQQGDKCGVIYAIGEIGVEDNNGITRAGMASSEEGEDWSSGVKGDGSGVIFLSDKDEHRIFEAMEDDRGCAVMNTVGLPTLKDQD